MPMQLQDRHNSRKRPQALPHLVRLFISYKGLLFPCGQPACGDAVTHMSGAHETGLEVISRCTVEFPATSSQFSAFCSAVCGCWFPEGRWNCGPLGGLLQGGWPFSAVSIHSAEEEFSEAYCTLAWGPERNSKC